MIAGALARVPRQPPPRCSLIALVAAAAAIGVIAAVALGVGDKQRAAQSTPTPTPTRDRHRDRHRDARRSPSRETTDGRPPPQRRPRRRRQRLRRLLQAVKARDRLGQDRQACSSTEPKVGVGVNDCAVRLRLRSGSPSHARRTSSSSTRTAAASTKRIPMPQRPARSRSAHNAVWVGLVPGNLEPDKLVKLDPKTGQTLATIAVPVRDQLAGRRARTPSGSLNRRRARLQRLDPDDRASSSRCRSARGDARRGRDLRRRRALGRHARRRHRLQGPHRDRPDRSRSASAAIRASSRFGDGVVYVTNYNSSDLYDDRREELAGRRHAGRALPVNPFAIAPPAATLWVTSQPDNKLTRLLRGRAG